MVEPNKPRALPFISYDQTSEKFIINPEAIQLISLIPQPIAVCSVAGMYRTGKSYLLNRMLLDQSSGFGVGPTINPCTKGLWIWSESIPGTSADGEPVNVLVVDTEGLGAFDETQNHDVRIFTLAILLSSSFIYNSMGSIDETSLNQLSLVVNLTKNIQLKEMQSTTEVDPEEYQKIFPTFTWVVRDFSLQLADENGAKISSREYLESALKEAKGFSDSVEQKNRIRRLLKTFFTERDCVTMVRPLSNEKELQNLANKPITDLRVEFQEQVKLLRRKVLGRVKPKTLQGKQLSGSILVTLAQQYVNSINSGAVPNIQSAWTYICQNESQKAIETALKHFQHQISQIKMPCDDSVVQKTFDFAKNQAKQIFKSKVIGGEIKESKQSLMVKLDEVCKQTRAKNEHMTELTMVEFLKQSYHPIEVSMHQGHFTTVDEFRACIHEFIQFVDEKSPPGFAHVKAQVCKDFIAQAVTSAASVFCDSLTQQNKTTQALLQERLKMQETQLSEVKTSLKSELDQTRQNLSKVEKEKAELSGVEQHLSEQMESLKSCLKDNEEKHLSELKGVEQSLMAQLEAKEDQYSMQSKVSSDAQRQIIQAQSELSKQSALAEQKIKFMEIQALEKDQKMQVYQTDLQEAKREASDLLKSTSSDLHLQIVDFKRQLEESDDRLQECQLLLKTSQESSDTEVQSLFQSNEDLEKQLKSSHSQVETLLQKIQSMEQNGTGKIDHLKSQLVQEMSQRKDLEIDMKQQLVEMTESSQIKIKDLEKELAVVVQKCDFQKVENSQLQMQVQERSHAHESILIALQEKAEDHSLVNDEAVEKIQELEMQCEAYSRVAESVKKELSEEINVLQQQLIESQEKAKLDLSESQRQLIYFKELLELSEQETQHLQLQNKSQHQTQLSDQKQSFQQTISKLEAEIESLQIHSETHITEMQSQAQDQLQELKQMYECDKQRLQAKFIDEKQLYQKQLQQMSDEYEHQIQDDQSLRDEDICILQQQMHDNDQQLRQTIQQLEFDLQSWQQKVQSRDDQEVKSERELNKTLRDLEIFKNGAEKLEGQLNDKLSELVKSLAIKEQEVDVLREKLGILQVGNEKLQGQVVENQNKAVQDGILSQLKLDELKSKSQQISDEALRQKLDASQAIALQKQRIEFQDRKVEDLVRHHENENVKFEARFKSLKIDYQQELQDSQQKLELQKEQIQQKCDIKRKKYKDAESDILKRINDALKEKDMVEQQLLNLQNVNYQLSLHQEQEVDQLNEQIINLQDQLQTERDMLQQELDRVKQLLNDLEREHCDLQNTSERDRALLEGKCQFLESQRDQAKSDYQEASRKFELTLEQIQKRGTTEHQPSTQAQTHLEMRYKMQIKDLQEEKQRLVIENDEAVSKLSKQLRELRLEIQLSEKDRQQLKHQCDKITAEANYREEDLRKLLQSSQNDKDTKSSSYVRNLEVVRDQQKQKLSDVEIRLKDSDSKRQMMVFELEKEKAKWAIEREQFTSSKYESKDCIDQLVRQKESLFKECEKLKTRKQLVMKTASQIAKSPMIEQSKQNVFVGGMSKTLMSLNIDESQENPTPRVDTSNSLMKGNKSNERSGRVNVINFNINRQKAPALTLSNITNFE